MEHKGQMGIEDYRKGIHMLVDMMIDVKILKKVFNLATYLFINSPD